MVITNHPAAPTALDRFLDGLDRRRPPLADDRRRTDGAPRRVRARGPHAAAHGRGGRRGHRRARRGRQPGNVGDARGETGACTGASRAGAGCPARRAPCRTALGSGQAGPYSAPHVALPARHGPPLPLEALRRWRRPRLPCLRELARRHQLEALRGAGAAAHDQHRHPAGGAAVQLARDGVGDERPGAAQVTLAAVAARARAGHQDRAAEAGSRARWRGNLDRRARRAHHAALARGRCVRGVGAVRRRPPPRRRTQPGCSRRRRCRKCW